MIRYIKYQNNITGSASEGKWYLRAVSDEQVDVDGLATHMAAHNTTYSEGTIKGILVDMVKCIKELLLEGKSVKMQDLAIFKIGLISGGADTAKEAKVSLVSGFRFNARATGEMSISELKNKIQLKELKHYALGDEDATIDDDPNEPNEEEELPIPSGGNNEPSGTTKYHITWTKHNGSTEVREYAVGESIGVNFPENTPGYIWTGYEDRMPAHDVVATEIEDDGSGL